MSHSTRVHIIGCGVMEADVAAAMKRLQMPAEFEFLEAGLHENPALLRQRLQERIDELSKQPLLERIVLVYGVCGRGVVGLRARRVPLVIPRVHDCIALFLGSDAAYREQAAKCPGTFYISAGWYEKKVQPSTKRNKQKNNSPLPEADFDRFQKKYGAENARMIVDFLNSWKRNYRRAAFIDTGIGDRDKYEEYARILAKEFGWDFETITGQPDLIDHLLLANRTTDRILWVSPHHFVGYDPLAGGLSASPVWEFGDETGHAHITTLEIAPETGESAVADSLANAGLGLGIDAGGTYTDAVVYDFADNKVVAKAKTLTTRWDYTEGIGRALDQLSLPKKEWQRIRLAAVSTTLATNAIVEGEGHPVGLLVMPPNGHLKDGELSHTPLSVIHGKMDISGNEQERPDPEEIRWTIRDMHRRYGIEGVAVSGYAGTVNPAHELLVKQVVLDELHIPVICGHELSDQLDFLVRANTAALNARIIPLVNSFLTDVRQALTDRNIQAPIMIVRGDGTLMSTDFAAKRPIETILSGPAASVSGARHLTHLDEATVLDMGGTTSDLARVHHGRVAIQDDGACVGTWRTHIRALAMRTIGLGGDSAILLRKRGLTIGPQRITPLCYLGSTHSKMTVLDYIEAHTDRFFVETEPAQVLVKTGRPPNMPLDRQGRQILGILDNGPKCLAQLAEEIGCGHWKLLRLKQLERSNLVQRCGLTPTDILHASGKIQLWPAEPGIRMTRILAALLNKKEEGLRREIMTRMTDALTLELLKRQLDENAADAAGCPLCDALLENILHDGNEHYQLSIQLHHPVVGLGAPVQFFLPAAARRLGVEAIIPKHAEAANALGAITSHVCVSDRLHIQPSETGTYTLLGISGLPEFSDFNQAHDQALELLVKRLRQQAREAGTGEQRVNVTIEDRVATAADGARILLERIITGEITGSPSVPTS